MMCTSVAGTLALRDSRSEEPRWRRSLPIGASPRWSHPRKANVAGGRGGEEQKLLEMNY